ncbi:MAG: Ion transport protein [Rhodobacteraceae bacterium HLUCCO18]|nr:MAG: Ion transport protein [Rhodobacteraceae bacterium HLUCCO18]
MTLSAPILLSIAVLFGAMTVAGIFPVLRLIRIHEAHHELKQGSASFLRSLAGWSIIAVWIGGAWFCATIIGDWAVTDDLDGAIDRAMVRLYVLLEILAMLAASD